MNWTKALPTQPGYYWWREDISCEARSVYVIADLRVFFHGIARPLPVADVGGQWYGPVEAPGGDAIENCWPNDPNGPPPGGEGERG